MICNKRKLRKMCSVLLSVAVTITMLPQISMTAHAAQGEPAMNPGATILKKEANTTNAQTVHMADNTWRVMGYGGEGVASSADTLALISSGNLKTKIQFRSDYEASDANYYSKSNLKTEIDAAANTFSQGEKTGIVARTLASGTFHYNEPADCVAGNPVENALLWPLSTKEANAMSNSLRMVNHLDQQNPINTWWLRSPGNQISWAAFVIGSGEVKNMGTRVSNEYGVRPAFNYNLDAIVLTTAATGGKASGALGADALTQVGTNAEGDWKITVNDDSYENFAVSEVTDTDSDVTVKYSGAVIGENEYISAVITDKPITAEGAKITYYGRIKNCSDTADASGSVTINTGEKLGESDYLYVFNEQCNGDKKTDFASQLQEVKIPETIALGIIEWQNDDEADRPEEIELSLFADEDKIASKTVKKGEYGLWSFLFDELPVFDSQGDKITYSISVEDVVYTDGRIYETTVETIEEYAFIITNKLPDKPVLTITAKDQTFAYNGKMQGPGDVVYADPAEIAEMVTVSGLVDGNTLSSIQIDGQGKEEGEYELTPSGARIGGESASIKYDVKYVSGKLKITHACHETKRVEPTCTQLGTEAYWTCEACKKMFSDKDGTKEIEKPVTIPATGHSWDAGKVTKKATCTEKGEMTYTCTTCKAAKKETIAALGHKYGAWTKLDDKQHQRVCAHNETHVEKANHSWDAGKVTKEATCTEKGETTFTCTGCKATKTEEIVALGHKYGAWTKLDDKQHQRVCEHNETHVEKANHSWDKGKVTKEPTTKAEGIKTYTCTVCGETKTEPIPKLKPEPTPTPTPDKSTVKPVLVAKGIAKGKKAVNLSWNKVSGADRYEIYMSKCNYKGKKYTMKKVKTVSGKTLKWTKKGLKKKTAYKFYVKALKKSGKKYKAIAKSKTGHFFIANVRGKYTNPKSLKLKKSKMTLKKGKSTTIKGTVAKTKKNKKLATGHAAKLRFTSNNPAVATVNAKGKVTAKAKGTATIYVQTINGIWKTCKVTVK